MFDPIRTVEQLIHRLEGSAFDYKTTYDLSTKATRYDIAKDVAAFANAYGGSIVVGIFEAQGRAVRLDGVADHQRLKADVATALQQHCVPVPSTPVDHEVLVSPADGARLLAASGAPPPPTDVTLVTLNVQSDPRAPIGVRPFDDENEKPLDHAYRFPLRVADQTRFMDPTELPMWMNSHERRMAILLERGLAGSTVGLEVVVFSVREGGQGSMSNRPFVSFSEILVMKLDRVDHETLTARFSTCTSVVHSELGSRRDFDGPVNVPLAFVSSVWPDAGTQRLCMALRGTLFPGAPWDSAFKPLAG